MLRLSLCKTQHDILLCYQHDADNATDAPQAGTKVHMLETEAD